MSDSSPLSEIPAIGYLSEVSLEHRQFLTSFGKFARPTDGEQIITQGEPQETLYLIIEGTLHVTSATDQRALLLASMGKGESLGEINLFDPAVASANVISRGDSLIWCLSRSELEGLFDADPEAGNSVMKGLLRQLSSRIRKMNEKLASSDEKSEFHDIWKSSSQ